jgi:NAD(P)H-nitrite reductase large subunit
MQHVILGNGIAGVSAAEAIRQLDAHAGITMVADETAVPYSRPMISMVLDGSVPPEKLPIRSQRFYEDLNIAPVLGKRVEALDIDRRRVLVQGGAAIGFDRLLIATGADARRIDAENTSLRNIFTMRRQAHVQHMLKVLPDARRALVLGGGLVGFKAAYGMMKRGLKVTMLITSAYPLSMQVDETAGRMILDELLRHGLEVRVGVSVTAFEGQTAVTGATLSDGRRLPCDMVVIGKGVVPAHAFVPRDPVALDLGILVDEHLETGADGIYAAGDVAQCVDIARGKPWINAIWPEAAAQGRIAGLNMAGRPVAYRGSLGRNVMRVFDMDVMTLGLVNPPGDGQTVTLTRHDRRTGVYRKLVLRENVLVGAMLINAVEQGGVLLGLIRNRVPLAIPAERLLASTFNFRQLMDWN